MWCTVLLLYLGTKESPVSDVAGSETHGRVLGKIPMTVHRVEIMLRVISSLVLT